MSRPPPPPGPPRPPPNRSQASPGPQGGRPAGSTTGSQMSRTNPPQAGPPRPGGSRPNSGGPAPNRVACKFCRRMFAEDRIEIHMAICRAHTSTKRQPFDSAKQRLDHLLQEKDIKKVTKAKKPPKLVNIPWKEAHNNWIGNKDPAKSRAGSARASTKSGGRPGGGTPTPPPMEPDDRIPCPGCGRKFNKLAAEKHIPYCVSKNR